jgi:Skp family chaperone for outer membrane proteins
MEPRSRTKLWAAATLAVVFASGIALGYAASATRGEAAEAASATRRGAVYEQFDRTEAQQARIDSIMWVHRKRMSKLNEELDEIRRRYRAASDSLSRATGEAISLVFPPDVSAEYLARLEERRAERLRARQEAGRRPRGGDRR